MTNSNHLTSKKWMHESMQEGNENETLMQNRLERPAKGAVRRQATISGEQYASTIRGEDPSQTPGTFLQDVLSLASSPSSFLKTQ
jgi:hypothetical protein